MTHSGDVFVEVGDRQDDIFVRAQRSLGALDGDRVVVEVSGRRVPYGRKREGRIVEILERSDRTFVGILHTVGEHAWVLMQSKSMPYDIEVPLLQAQEMGAERGMKVAARVERWNRGDDSPKGRLTDVLGFPGGNDAEMHAILAEYGLPYRFEKEVEDAADAISAKISRRELGGRKDFRDALTFTIDPSDAKDFDDAVSFRRLDGGNVEVGVHIADVSFYVRPGDPVDREARNRGTSVYLVDRTVPMLPEKLCNRLCSLREGEDKLTFSVVFEMTPDAAVVRSWLGRTVIRSDRRLDYGSAQAVIKDGGSVSPEIDDALRSLNAMAERLRKARLKAGAINFSKPEMKVEVDGTGKPLRVYRKESVEANWLIEEFMLLANRTVAKYIAVKGGRPSVYRIHPEPDQAKLQSLKKFAKGYGYILKTGRDTPGSLNAMLAKSKGRPEHEALETLALKAMAKASYSTDNIGHYGLAFEYYTHFTSPIRRYPDIMVHRILSSCLEGGEKMSRGVLEGECRYASEREIVATEAERTSIKYKMVEFMRDKVGGEFYGVVCGVTDWGVFVRIEPTMIEGMIPRAYCPRKILRLGRRVRVRVRAANLDLRQLDFELVE